MTLMSEADRLVAAEAHLRHVRRRYQLTVVDLEKQIRLVDRAPVTERLTLQRWRAPTVGPPQLESSTTLRDLTTSWCARRWSVLRSWWSARR